MNIKKLLNELLQYPHELEWLEYKENWFEPKEVGRYISAISNSAAISGKEFGYLIWGINEKNTKLSELILNIYVIIITNHTKTI